MNPLHKLMVDECFSGGETLSIRLLVKEQTYIFGRQHTGSVNWCMRGKLKIVFRKDGRKAIKTLYYVWSLAVKS